MAKRKQKNVELERQMKQRRMIFRVISLLVTAVIVFAVGMGIWIVQDSRWVLRYDGGRVSVNDFRAVFEAGFGGDPMARDAAIQSLQLITTLRDRAIYHNADFTQEERDAAEQDAHWNIRMDMTFQMGFDPLFYISDERLAELFFTDPLIQRLMDIYAHPDALGIDEAHFAELLEAYLENDLHRHLDLQLFAVISEDREEIEEAYSLIGTMDFEEIARQFTPGIGEDDDVQTTSAVALAEWFGFDPEDEEYFLGLAEGEHTRIIEVHDEEFSAYFIFYAVSRAEPDPEAAAESFREDFVDEVRTQVFTDLLDQWTEEANFRVNRRGYNSI
ncbi:MAG: hypothetical protein FWC92_09965 [Defluviitaleaceae bacterium]|nr:hypothetical protein [Defluviitaleaceae bacterium]